MRTGALNFDLSPMIGATKYGEYTFLTASEMETIENCNGNFKRKKICQDTIFIACHTGLSFSNLLQLTKDHFFTEPGRGVHLQMDIGQKSPLVIPIEQIFGKETVAEILKKLTGHSRPIGKSVSLGQLAKGIWKLEALLDRQIRDIDVRSTFVNRCLVRGYPQNWIRSWLGMPN